MPLKSYINSISKTTLLSEEDTNKLISEYIVSRSPIIRDKIIKHNMRLALKVAHKYNMTKILLPDLLQEGSIGLMRSIDKYDPKRNVPFGTYAYKWIRAYILRYIINNAKEVKIGTTQAQRKLFFNLAKTKALLQNKGIDISDEDLAAKLDVKVSELQEVDQRMSAPSISLDANDSDNQNQFDSSNFLERSRVDIIINETEMPSNLYERLEETIQIQNIVKKFEKNLSNRDKEILNRRLFCEKPDTLQEIGDDFGITKERVRQLESNLISKIEKTFARNNFKLNEL